MSFFKHFCLVTLLLIGIAGQTGTLRWLPSSEMGDHDIDPGPLVGGMYSLAFSLFTKELSDSTVADRVKIYYFSRQNPENPITLNPDTRSDLVMRNIHKPFKIIIHGFLHSAQNAMTVQLRRQILQFHDVNVINVDWSSVSRHPWYFIVAQRTQIIGRYVAKLLDQLISQGANPEDIHLIGHSLGSHVAGYAGSNLRGGKLGRITGLDPALPGFKTSDVNKRLDPSDAEFVDCIHTCGGSLGFMAPICHADFYPNGGRNYQPGCLITDFIGMCSHLRAPAYFHESVDPQYKFTVAKCSEIPNKFPVDCTISDYNMGYYLNHSARGIFYGTTNFRPPYSRS